MVKFAVGKIYARRQAFGPNKGEVKDFIKVKDRNIADNMIRYEIITADRQVIVPVVEWAKIHKSNGVEYVEYDRMHRVNADGVAGI